MQLHNRQPALFKEDDLPFQAAYDVDAMRVRLQGMLDKMRAAASWPWKSATVASYRESLWPSLLAKLPDCEEVIRFRVELAAEAARLDAAE